MYSGNGGRALLRSDVAALLLRVALLLHVDRVPFDVLLLVGNFEYDSRPFLKSDFAAPESTRKPPLHTRGICRARSFDLEVTPWAPTRLTSCISPTGPEESSGASTWGQTAQARP